MNYSELVKALKEGTIKVDKRGHRMNSPVDRIERNLERWKKQRQEYVDKVAKGITRDDGSSYKGMVELYDWKLGEVANGGHTCDSEHYCFDCDKNMYGVLIGDTLTFMGITDYWDARDKWGEKNSGKNKHTDFTGITIDQIEDCIVGPLRASGKLTAEVEFPTGEVVFQNYFNKRKLYELPKDREYKEPSINAVLGVQSLMNYLAGNGVGYGQMGNMSVTVYSNEKDEVIIGDCLDSYHDNKIYYDKYPEQAKADEDWLKQVVATEAFIKELEVGNFKRLGQISLSVWRWQCADKQTLKNAREKHKKIKNDEKYHTDACMATLTPGKYRLEHYFEFSGRHDPIYSRLKLIK